MISIVANNIAAVFIVNNSSFLIPYTKWLFSELFIINMRNNEIIIIPETATIVPLLSKLELKDK